ncbi:hypothetical protein DV737_g4698, partial [Chaetothyriales sp. CBS 132003]
MPFKPFAHLARVSIAKGISHSYTPSVVAAGQNLTQFQNQTAAKFSKTGHSHSTLQQAFTSASGSSGAGAKAGSSAQSNGGDAGLAQYYAAWHHAQQTGDDTDWKAQQNARRIGWKDHEKNRPVKLGRLESGRPADLLRPSVGRVRANRTLSEGAVLYDGKTDIDGAEVLVRADEAIAKEIAEVNAAAALVEEVSIDDDVGPPLSESRAATPIVQGSAEGSAAEDDSSLHSSHACTPTTTATSPVSDESLQLCERIIKLGQQYRYAEIPAVFESLIRNGHVPTVDAYNHILLSAIHLGEGYQPWPRVLEVYGDMAKRSVAPNDATYGILLQFLTRRGLEISKLQKQLDKRAVRYGTAAQPFIFSSIAHQQQLYADDISLAFASKLYNIARATLKDFSLSAAVYNGLVRACAQLGMVEQMSTLLSDMKLNAVNLDPRLYTTIIDAYSQANDVPSAQSIYEEYRDLAIMRAANDPFDMQVYAALIKAYYAAGLAETGRHFFDKVLQSFVGTANEQQLASALTRAFVMDGLVQHHVDNKAFGAAIESLSDIIDLGVDVKQQALSKIAVAAADANEFEDAARAFSAITTPEAKAEPVLALTAMHLRAKNIDAARAVWREALSLPLNLTTDFAAMYGLTFIRAGAVEEGVSEARAIFQYIRAAAPSESVREVAMAEIDEAILLFGEALVKQQAVVSAPTSVTLLRMMIENGGLVSPVAEDAVASLGPECIHQLNAQDIALALHVQAQMLPTEPAAANDMAQTARFSHLLETVLTRQILMDPSTVNVVSEAVPRMASTRPDLVRKWHEFLHPIMTGTPAPQPMTPISAAPSTFATPVVADTFDPYAHTTDFRASKVISDMVESTTGRIETRFNDALGRFRNVRRAGRHLHYTAYAKLITAAAKAKQPSLIHEIISMAQSDVPLTIEVPSVRGGWVSILDAAVAACLTVGDGQLAGKYHQQLLDMGAAPSANTFGIYITTLEGTFDEASEAVKVFQRAIAEGVTPSVFLYNAVIGKLGKARRIDDCLRYFGEMQNLGLRPSSVTYGTLVNALCRTSEESFAVEMFDEMESAPNYRPRPAPYNSIIQYFLNTKRDRSKVLQYYERMKTRNIKPTSHTYKLLIEAYASLEPVNLEAAEALLEEMKAAGTAPEAVHYGTLIHAKGCVMHDMEGARATFASVLADSSVRVTDNLYQNLLEAMVANHEVDKTPEVLQDMASRGVRMTPYIANTLIHGWASEKKIDKAKAVFNELGFVHREPSTYEAMTRAFLTVGQRDDADKVVTEMLKKGYPSAVSEKVMGLMGTA